MVRIVLGSGLPEEGFLKVDAVTLGAALAKVEGTHPWARNEGVRVFVGGVDASRLEGEKTPVGDEDTVLLTGF